MTQEPRKPGQANPALMQWLVKWVGPLIRLAFRPSIKGWAHLPSDRAFLLVANHSAGMGLAELASIVDLYYRQYGHTRPLAGFALALAFRLWPLSWILPALGAVPSTYEDAYKTLEAGVPMLVFPGGDHETLRPIWQANQVDFNGRKGFLKIAQQAQVPIVPMGIYGSHYTAPMLYRARWLAWVLVLPRVVGLKRWGISLLDVLVALVLMACGLPWYVVLGVTWWWTCSPMAFLPIVPATIRMQIGEPIPPPAKDGDLDVLRHKVERTIEALLLDARDNAS